MSKIDALIKKSCPNGVPYKRIDEVCVRNSGLSITAGQMRELHDPSGDVRIFAGGQTTADVRAEVINGNYLEGPGLIVKSRGHIDFEFWDGRYSHKNELWSYKPRSSELELKYLYYLLKTKVLEVQLVAKANSVKMPQIKVGDIDGMNIPFPPLEVQREIVSILDRFTQLEAALKAELKARKIQMEHYARSMTEIFSMDELTTRTLAEVAEIGTGSRNTQDAIAGGTYPFYVRSQLPLTSNQYEFDEQAVITAGDGVGVGKVFHFADGKYSLHQRAYRVKPKNSFLDPKFLFYYMKNNFGLYLESAAVHASVTSLRKPMFEKFEITYPSLEAQRKIVYFLDQLETYLGDKNQGLLGEIELRGQQFEYVRNKLLTFEKQVVA